MKKQQPTFQRKALCQAIVLATAMTAAGASYGQITITDEKNVTQYVENYDVIVTGSGQVNVTGHQLPGSSNGEDTGQVEGIYADSSPYTGTLVNDGDIYAGARNNITTSNPTISTTSSTTGLTIQDIVALTPGEWDVCNTSGNPNNYSCRNIETTTIEHTFTAQAKAVRVGELQGSITNNGDITASAEIDSNPSNTYSDDQSAIGIYADSITLTGSIINNGGIEASAEEGQAAIGIEVNGNMSGNIVNYSYIGAFAPLATSTSESSSDGGSAAGLYIDGNLSGNVTNNGGIIAAADFAAGIVVGGNVTGSITNSSYIGAFALTSFPPLSSEGSNSLNGTAMGIYVEGNLSGSVSNNGGIFAGGKNAAGIVVAGTINSSGSILNGTNGSINVYADSSSYSPSNGAVGMAANTVNGGSVTNNGMINVYGGPNRNGISVGSLNDGSIVNAGTINITSESGSSSYNTGIYVSDVSGDASITNSGSINVDDGVGIYLDGDLDGNAKIVNAITSTGTGTAIATYTGSINIGSGTGIYVNGYLSGSESGSAKIVNSGTIDISSSGAGIYVEDGLFGNASISNKGTIEVEDGTGIYVGSSEGVALSSGASISNTINARIDITSNGTGIYVDGDIYNAAINNNGVIHVDADTGAGIVVSGSLSGSANILNNGTIDVSASESAVGIFAASIDSGAEITNNGIIDASASYFAAGILGIESDGTIINSEDGEIYVDAGSFAIGMGVFETLSGTMQNDGLISVSQSEGSGESNTAIGMGAGYVAGNIINNGTITVQAGSGFNSNATGISVYAVNDGSITNHGEINVYGGAGIAVGSSSSSSEGGLWSSASILNSGTIYATSYAATGISVTNIGSDAKITNNGTITAEGYVWAVGIDADSDIDGQIINGTDGVIEVSGMYGGTGIYAGGVNTGASIVNSGLIDVSSSSYSEGGGYGIYVGYVYGGSVINNGTIQMNNGTGIHVSESVAGYTESSELISSGLVSNDGLIDISGEGYGIYAGSVYDSARVINAGTINVGTSTATESNTGYGIRANEVYNSGAVINSGTINVNSGYGIYIEGYVYDGGSVSNDGVINVDNGTGMYFDSSFYSTGAAYNNGTINIGTGIGIDAYAVGYYEGDEDRLINNGTINVDSGTGIYADYIYEDGKIINDTEGTIDIGTGYGIGVYSATGSGEIINNGNITVDDGSGIYVSYMYSSAAIINNGTINVGSGGNGIYAYSYSSPTSAEVINSGIINVGGSGYAGIYAYGDITVTNSGTITATGGADGVNVDGDLENTIDGQIIADYNYIGGNLVNAGILSGDLSVSGNASNSNTIDLTYDGGKGGYIGGDFTQTADGILIFEVADKETYSRLYVDGTATVDGTIGFNLTAQDQLRVGDTLDDLVSATSLVSGTTFASEDNSILLDLDVYKDGDTIDATIVPGVTLQEIVSTSPESQFTDNLAMLLDTWIGDPGGLNPNQDEIINALLDPANTTTDLQLLLTQYTPALSGHSLQALNSVLASVASIINNRVSSVAAMQRGASSGDTNFSSKAFWIRPFYNDSEQKSHSNVYGYDAEASGLVFGIDGAVNDDWRLGAAFAYGTNKVDARGVATGQQIKSDSYQLSLYGNWTLAQSNFANFQLAFGQNDNDTQRVIGSSVNRGNYNSYFVQAAAEYGQSYAMNDKLSLTPSASAVYTYVNEKGYTETGAGPTLIVDGRNADSFLLGLDAELAYNVELGKLPAALTAHVGVAYDTQAESSELSASFTAGGPKFITPGLKPDDTTVRGGVGLQIFTEKAWDLSINYDIDSRQSFTGQTASVKVNIPF